MFSLFVATKLRKTDTMITLVVSNLAAERTLIVIKIPYSTVGESHNIGLMVSLQLAEGEVCQESHLRPDTSI